MPIPHVLADLTQPWAIIETKLQQIVEAAVRHDAGETLSAEEVRAIVAAAPDRGQPGATVLGYVGVLPLWGSIFPKANMMTENSGGTSLRKFALGFRQLVNDPAVKAIVLDVDSPGGATAGVPEMAAEIMAARGTKPIVAVANTVMASAAAWIAFSADRVVATLSADVGSIGVFYPHRDVSGQMKQQGVSVEYVSAGEGKTSRNSGGPLSDEARARIQQRVDEIYGSFVDSVARGRRVDPERVRNEWKAEVYSAREALGNGMIDEIATLDEVIAGLAAAPAARGGRRADADDGEAQRRLIRSRIAAR
jgi:signal peptide peptidase SppA